MLGIKHPKLVDGFEQDPMDGVSMVCTFADAKATGRKKTQYFENNGSRGIYHDGWYACTFGPLVPVGVRRQCRGRDGTRPVRPPN